MQTYKYISSILTAVTVFTAGCGEIVTYPDSPVIDYKKFSLYITNDTLGNKILQGTIEFTFTDGDGDVGLSQPSNDTTQLPDTLRYNFFTSLYDFKNDTFRKITGPVGEQNFRIPYMERTGQNKTLKGTITVDLQYFKPITYDTIFYTFYMMDRQFHHSNTDTTDIIVFTGLDF
jgi:hypothetical protein